LLDIFRQLLHTVSPTVSPGCLLLTLLTAAAAVAPCSHKPGSTDKCEPFTQDILTAWIKAFIPCLDYAVKAGFDIAFTPHLDDGLASGVWRNAMLINPLAK
jgi:2,4-dienoyl-CoA reductase-like NADH-dependent reductase (Old Yellow Enzyme family)